MGRSIVFVESSAGSVAKGVAALGIDGVELSVGVVDLDVGAALMTAAVEYKSKCCSIKAWLRMDKLDGG